MIGKIAVLFFRVRVTVPSARYETVWNFFYKNNITYRIIRLADGRLSFSLPRRLWDAIMKEEPQMGQDATVTVCGILPFLIRYRNRAGLLLGGALALCLFFFMRSCVWDIRIRGNEMLSSWQIKEILADVGLKEGAKLADLDTKTVAGQVLLASDALSFVGINMRGTVAYVDVIEAKTPQKEEHTAGGANLVAAYDAVIEDISVKTGALQVHRGQVVKQGDLLVSGLREGSQSDRIVRAEGEVFGRVKKTFTVSLPYKITVRQPVGRKTAEIRLVFWENSINIYANTGNLPSTYGTIYEEEQLYLGKETRLPFGLRRTVILSYAEQEKTLTNEELVRLATRRLEEQMAQALQGCEIYSKSISGRFVEDGYVLTCEVSCCENIAKVVEFDAR